MFDDPPNTRYEFVCPDCGYTAEVCGREGACRIGSTVTIVCETCRDLNDVLIWQVQNPIYVEPRCPNDSNHTVAVWTFPGPCPKCGAKMKVGRYKALLD